MNKTKISLPQSVEQVLARLEAAGFEAYAVGGCVRDSLLGPVLGGDAAAGDGAFFRAAGAAYGHRARHRDPALGA